MGAVWTWRRAARTITDATRDQLYRRILEAGGDELGNAFIARTAAHCSWATLQPPDVLT